MNTSLPKQHLPISFNRDFYEELNRKSPIAKTFKKNSDKYELLLTDLQLMDKPKVKLRQKISLGFQNTLRNLFDLILKAGNLPIIRDVLDVFRFLSTPRK